MVGEDGCGHHRDVWCAFYGLDEQDSLSGQESAGAGFECGMFVGGQL